MIIKLANRIRVATNNVPHFLGVKAGVVLPLLLEEQR